jgi:hypothetical protein
MEISEMDDHIPHSPTVRFRLLRKGKELDAPGYHPIDRTLEVKTHKDQDGASLCVPAGQEIVFDVLGPGDYKVDAIRVETMMSLGPPYAPFPLVRTVKLPRVLRMSEPLMVFPEGEVLTVTS